MAKKIEQGKTYLFTKSGNKVRVIEPAAPYLGQAMWEVERVDGASAGKRMDVPASALKVLPEKHTVAVHTSLGKATLELEREGRTFNVVDFRVEASPEQGLVLAFEPRMAGFKNLDADSDIAQCFDLSTKVSYGKVVLGSSEMRASSIEELQQVLKLARMHALNHESV